MAEGTVTKFVTRFVAFLHALSVPFAKVVKSVYGKEDLSQEGGRGGTHNFPSTNLEAPERTLLAADFLCFMFVVALYEWVRDPMTMGSANCKIIVSIPSKIT